MQKCKKIIYLDQNFISNLAKASYVEDWKDLLKNAYLELHTLLSELTDDDKLICPSSSFHREESELGYGVKEFLWHFVEKMGFGLSFKPSSEIRHCQVISAARAYCGLPATQQPTWKSVFNRDPQIPIGQLSRPALLVDFPNSQEFNEYLRLSKVSIANEYSAYKVVCRGKRRVYADEIEVQKKQFVLEMFRPRTELNIKPSKEEQILNILGLAGIIEFNRSIVEILKCSTNPEGFFVSRQLLDCPYISVWASLVAADIFFYPDKKQDNSLLMDFEIVASVLPYVDILGIDSYIYQLIRNAKLSDCFGAHIFSVRQIEALIAQLRKL